MIIPDLSVVSKDDGFLYYELDLCVLQMGLTESLCDIDEVKVIRSNVEHSLRTSADLSHWYIQVPLDNREKMADINTNRLEIHRGTKVDNYDLGVLMWQHL